MTEPTQYLASVVIVSYNGLGFLRDCLDSVLDQDLPRSQYEVIVADNNSGDGSADFVERHYPTVQVIRFDKNYGPNRAIHMVLPRLRGKYPVYLHQDTIVDRRWLSQLLRVFEQHPQVAVVESNVILPTRPEYDTLRRECRVEHAYVCDVNEFGIHEFRTEPATATSPPIRVLAAYGPSVMVSSQILEDLDFFLDRNLYMHADDLDIGLRLNLAGYEVVMAPGSVVYHDTDRWHFKWDVRSALKAFYATRNMVLVLYQICYWPEFVRLLPRMMYGKLLKAQENVASPLLRVLHALAAIPLVLLCLISAFLKMPAYRKRRALTMRRRTMPSGWLSDRFRTNGWRQDPPVMQEGLA